MGITAIPGVQLGDIFDLCRTGQFEVCRIVDVRFDPIELDQILTDVLAKYPLMEKDGYETYKAICLQYRTGASDLLYGDVGQMQGVIVDGEVQDGAQPRAWCIERNQIGDLFKSIWETPLPEYVILLRGRIIQALPGFTMSWHNDGPDNRRIHIPIRTNRSSLLQYKNGNSYHMPADGSVYIVNATNDHRALNLSAQPRTHITFSFLPLPPELT